MSDAAELAIRQERLLLRSAALRASMAEQAQVLETPFAIADRLHDGVRWMWRERVVLIGGTAVALIVLRPRRVWRLAWLGFWTWRRTRRVRAWLRAEGMASPAAAPAPHT